MKRRRRIIVGVGGGVLLLAGCTTREVTVRESEVPDAVLRAFRQQYPGAVVKGYAKETKGLSVLYEIETDGAAAPHTVVYKRDGKLAEAEVRISPSALPVAVREAVGKLSPTGTIKGAELSQQPGQSVYEVEIAEADQVVEYKFDSLGRALKKEVKGK
jgi:uncharacterized membrane protein YkoI